MIAPKLRGQWVDHTHAAQWKSGSVVLVHRPSRAQTDARFLEVVAWWDGTGLRAHIHGDAVWFQLLWKPTTKQPFFHLPAQIDRRRT
jgi:hypothetical protein